MRLRDYNTLVFDCDGVVLDSNKIKTAAFFDAATPYGERAANALVKHHVTNGGISRYAKFTYFLEHIVPAEAAGPSLDELLQRYAANVATGLASCAIADGLAKLRKKAGNSRWLVASGGDQAELRDVFRMRGIAPFFDGGIFGSPDTKEQILAREIESGNISFPGLLMGDSTYDHRVACQSGLDFVFISDWSELKDWESYVKTHGLAAAPSLLALAERDQAFGTNEVSREGQ